MKLRFEHSIRLPIRSVFGFHEDPANLGDLLRECHGFRLLHHDGHILPGSTTWFEQMIGKCIPVVMGFRHTIFEPPTRFGEELFHGPFRRFTHVHEFEQIDGGTIVRDLLEVELPWYYGGEPAVRICVVPMLRRVFALRHRALDQLALQTMPHSEHRPAGQVTV